MIIKEQAQNNNYFLQIARVTNANDKSNDIENFNTVNAHVVLAKPSKWRANGKCKTWKRQSDRFQLPIKHGLYNYAYITNDNAHLFTVE